MTHDIDDLFGLKVKTERSGFGKRKIIPPPPRVMAVLTGIAIKKEHPLRSKTKARLRRNKARRIERQNAIIRRNIWRGIGEKQKALAAQSEGSET